MYKGDFVRLKNVQLGYNLQSNVVKKMGFQAFRVYVSGTNLWTKTKFPMGSGRRCNDRYRPDTSIENMDCRINCEILTQNRIITIV